MSYEDIIVVLDFLDETDITLQQQEMISKEVNDLPKEEKELILHQFKNGAWSFLEGFI